MISQLEAGPHFDESDPRLDFRDHHEDVLHVDTGKGFTLNWWRNRSDSVCGYPNTNMGITSNCSRWWAHIGHPKGCPARVSIARTGSWADTWLRHRHPKKSLHCPQRTAN